MVTVSDKRLGQDLDGNGMADFYFADVTSATDYYPFGSVQPGRSLNSGEYRFGFNGHEKEGSDWTGSDGSHLDFGARIYDARLGRFFSTDPWESKYAWQTPYAYFSNSPILIIDWKGYGGEEIFAKNVKKEFDFVRTNFSITIYVEQPIVNSREKVTGANVGHTFVKIVKANSTTMELQELIIDFHPKNPVMSVFGNETSKFKINSGYEFNISVNKSISETEFNEVLNYILKKMEDKEPYILNEYNCTDFALECAKKANVTLPDNPIESEEGGFTISGSNPADLGADLISDEKKIEDSEGVTITKFESKTKVFDKDAVKEEDSK